MLKYINSSAAIMCSMASGADLIIGSYVVASIMFVLAISNLFLFYRTIKMEQ